MTDEEKDKDWLTGGEKPITSLDEAIEAAEQASLKMSVMRLRSISFDPPVMIVRKQSGSQITRYDAADHGWNDWTVEIMNGFISFTEKATGRAFMIPQHRAVIEHAPSCPRCGSFLARAGDPCRSPNCTWPKAERRVCPECKSQIPRERKTCPNPKCKWGWEDPDAKPAIETAKEFMREKREAAKKEAK